MFPIVKFKAEWVVAKKIGEIEIYFVESCQIHDLGEYLWMGHIKTMWKSVWNGMEQCQ